MEMILTEKYRFSETRKNNLQRVAHISKSKNAPIFQSKKLSAVSFVASMVFILLGGLVFLYWLYSTLNTTDSRHVTTEVTPVTAEPVSLTLTVSNPEENFLTFKEALTLEGKAIPYGLIILSEEEKDTLIEADGKGEFSQPLILKPGPNEITVTLIDTQGNSKTETRTIFYSTEKL